MKLDVQKQKKRRRIDNLCSLTLATKTPTVGDNELRFRVKGVIGKKTPLAFVLFGSGERNFPAESDVQQ